MSRLPSPARPPRPARRRGWASAGLLALLASLAVAPPASAQITYATADDAYTVGVIWINGGNLAAAVEPLEVALKMAKTDAMRVKVNRALMTPYRELPEVVPMQKAAEHVLTFSDQPYDRTASRQALLTFLRKRGKLDAALTGYEARLEKSPDDRTVLYILTEAYASYKEDPEKSAGYAVRLAAVEKKSGKGQDVASQAQLAQQFVKAGKFKEGAALFEAIAPLDPKLEAWHLKEAAAVWLKAGDKVKAVAAAKKSAAAPPEKRGELLTYFWHRGVADTLLDSGEPAAAVLEYEKAIAACTIDGYLKDTRGRLAEAQAATKK